MTDDSKTTGVGDSSSKFGVANPLHATLNDGNGNAKSFSECSFEGHDGRK